jgi:DNA-binding response OmpR family regulator
MADLRVLVASGDPAVLEAARTALSGKGYSVTPAQDGEAAYEEAAKAPPHVLVVDPALAKLDGVSLVRKIRAKPEWAMIPVVFLGERAEVERRILGFRASADDYMPKPVDAQELALRVSLAIRVRARTETTIRTKLGESGEWTVMLSGFRGTLDEVGLPSLMSLIEMERKSGLLVLRLEGVKHKVRVQFRNGRIVRASLDHTPSLRNAELIYRLLSRTRGEFDFRPVAIEAGDEVNSTTTQLLLEAARRLDENARKTQAP